MNRFKDHVVLMVSLSLMLDGNRKLIGRQVGNDFCACHGVSE